MWLLLSFLFGLAQLPAELAAGEDITTPVVDVVTMENFVTGRKWTRIYGLNFMLKNTPLDFEVVQGYRKENPEVGVLLKVTRREFPIGERSENPFLLRLDSHGRFVEFQLPRNGINVPVESIADRRYPDDVIGNCFSARLLQVYIPLPITYRGDEADQVHPWRPIGPSAIAYCIKRPLGQNRLQVTVIYMDKSASSTVPQEGKMPPVVDVYTIVYGLNEPWPLEVHCARDNRYDFATPPESPGEKVPVNGPVPPPGTVVPKPAP